MSVNVKSVESLKQLRKLQIQRFSKHYNIPYQRQSLEPCSRLKICYFSHDTKYIRGRTGDCASEKT